MQGPAAPPPASLEAIHAAGAQFWPLRVARELDDLFLHLRANEEEIGIWVFKTQGSVELVEAHDRALQDHAADWLVREIRLYLGRKDTMPSMRNTTRFADPLLYRIEWPLAP